MGNEATVAILKCKWRVKLIWGACAQQDQITSVPSRHGQVVGFRKSRVFR